MNGIIVVNKPKGKTSHDIVYFMRRVTGIRKIGHTGTLDPMAEGVLPICIGSATKAADMLTFSDKRYTAELLLGITTDTQDAEGEIVTESEVNLTAEEITDAISCFTGEIEQLPPMYSAVKQNGRKLYELARKGIVTEREKRAVKISEINILDIDLENNTVKIDVLCSKGTYIRTLCADIGERLGVGAHMTALTRTRTGRFTIEDSYTLPEIEEMSENGSLSDAIIPIDALFDDYPKITLNEKQTRSIINGVRMSHSGVEGQSYRLYDNNGRFLCVSKMLDGRLTLEKSFWT